METENYTIRDLVDAYNEGYEDGNYEGYEEGYVARFEEEDKRVPRKKPRLVE